MADLLPIGSPVEKIGGSYGGPGIVRGHAKTAKGEIRYLVGHRIETAMANFSTSTRAPFCARIVIGSRS